LETQTNIDTRVKIVDAARAARIAQDGATLISGYFDPMIAFHAERLATLKKDGQPLLVLIATPRDAILPAAARAQLVAGLSVVDYVCDTPGDLRPQIALEAEHAELLDQLIRHVHARQRAAS
jgi:bifunctional ADP-heptose synthase (sugar kinase/adenylyltransferase)